MNKLKMRTKIALRDGYRCAYCGTESPPFEIEHVIPLSKGGNNYLTNLVFSCHDCNTLKSNKLPDEIDDLDFRDKVLDVVLRIRHTPNKRNGCIPNKRKRRR